jgi:rhamnulokinase
MSDPLYIAVDLGAGSGRVFLAGIGPGELLLDETHRFHYPPREAAGHLRWDFQLIFGEIKRGLRAAGERARVLGREVRSIGIDGWGVDYGLLDAEGKVIADPVCYRDGRTGGIMDRVFERVPRSKIFESTGIQFLPFNTIFQLYAGKAEFDAAERLLLLPDLVNYMLTGRVAAEYSNATTTQMVNAATGRWDDDLLGSLDLSKRSLPEIIPSGSDLGPLKKHLANELRLDGVHVIAPATHDTGSAVAGAPLGERSAYISSGTWSLIGIELDSPLINSEVGRLNFTNEGGAYGTFRFLKNVMGLWILESCRKEWIAAGLDADYEKLLASLTKLGEAGCLIFPDDERFLNPPSMLEAIGNQLKETEQQMPGDPALVSSMIFDSLAFRYASVLKSIETLTGIKPGDIFILGGGGRNRYLNQMTANASGLTVRAGLTEATVVGNVLVQAIAAGRFASLAEARQHVSENVTLEEYSPDGSAEIESARRHYARIEARYID